MGNNLNFFINNIGIISEDPLQFVSTLALYQFYRKHTKILRIIEYIFIMMMESTTLWVLFVIIVTKNISYIERFLLFQMIQQNVSNNQIVYGLKLI